MLSEISRLLRYATGSRIVETESISPSYLALRYGRTKTVFVKASSQVLQNSKLVGTFASIDHIELHQPRDQEGPANWFVKIQLQGRRQIEVGQITDQMDASVVGARIATITGRPVIVKP